MEGTKEFDDLMEQFERDIKEMPIYGHLIKRANKNDKTPHGVFYDDGLLNQLFHAYMRGYSYHKSLSLT